MIYSLEELFMTGPSRDYLFIIPTFNNPEYLRMMVRQLNQRYVEQILVVDNCSTHPEMINLLNSLDQEDNIFVVKKFTNDGPTEFYRNPRFLEWLPQKFFITDPDIGFNKNLPEDFIAVMEDVSEEFKCMRVGFALDIEMEGIDHNMHDIMFHTTGLTMYQWEDRFWQDKVGETKYGDPIYSAPIDTTFCFINKKYDVGDYYNPSVRIAGNFTAQHYGWYNNPPIPNEELEYYLAHIPGHWSETGNAIKRKRNQ